MWCACFCVVQVSLELPLGGTAWGQSPLERMGGGGGGAKGQQRQGLLGRAMGWRRRRGGEDAGGEDGDVELDGPGGGMGRRRRRGGKMVRGVNKGFWGLGQQRQLLEEYEEEGEGGLYEDEGDAYWGEDEGEAGVRRGSVPAGSAAARLVVARRELQAAQAQLQVGEDARWNTHAFTCGMCVVRVCMLQSF